MGAAWIAVFIRMISVGCISVGRFLRSHAPDHIMDYLPTGPAMGLAIVLGAALASRWRAAAIVIEAFYLAVSLPAAWDVTCME
jgi:hypothetical protein